MQKFNNIASIATPMPIINIDTDMIIPKQFLTTIERTGLGKSLFYEMRYGVNGEEIPDFILNKNEYKNSQILIAKDNFGCGSSREHAPWALLDFGFRVIIAPSFADIFFSNCFKNGILPIILENKIIDELLDFSKKTDNLFRVDLQEQKIFAQNKVYEFNIDYANKEKLIEGLDDIALTLKQISQISDFEKENQSKLPWLWA
ncbi:MAG: 3-isopropylmalate dehydratase small subunit [Rickettsiales bacterium]|nr:3-isopropylmalate dehydratase small subunit [Rickettsiales bacterium]